MLLKINSRGLIRMYTTTPSAAAMTLVSTIEPSFELSPRQATYVKRLSQITGREIVPIDLDLYRELLKLEIIIDKGRRLALTKLGKMVAATLA